MMRAGIVTFVGMVVAALGLSIVLPPAPRLIWNASASVPIGLYAVGPIGALHADELVVVQPPPQLAAFLSARAYLPQCVPLLKHIAALPGQTVCRSGRTITVDQTALGEALDRDRRGRTLPQWHGCKRVAEGTVFLMNARVRDSLDGRYFGVLPAATIIGQATPIWTLEEQ